MLGNKILVVLLPLLVSAADLATVVSKPISRTIDLPGKFLPFLSTPLHAKVRGYVERVLVDRGSTVKQGQLLIELTAPEMDAEIAQAQSMVEAAQADRIRAEAQVADAQASGDRLKKAAETPGAISANELSQADKQVEAAQALVQSREQATRAAESLLQARKDLQVYLKITAPFDGVVTNLLVHPGMLAGPGADPGLLEIQEIARLRLVVALPEEDVAGLTVGTAVSFTVPAFPERTFSGRVARIAKVDQKVELEVNNRDRSLAPGMYPSVKWPARSSQSGLFVPKTSVVITTGRTFVIRDRNGRAEWVDVKTGISEGDLVQVTGNLQTGDRVVRRGTDKIKPGASLK